MNRKTPSLWMWLPLVPALVLTSLAFAMEGKTLVNVDKQALAIQGHDPVAYFTVGKATLGSADHTSAHGGATYRFASAENKQAFDAHPAKYAPQFGGYCAYAVAKGKLAKIDPEAFMIVGDRLLLQYDKSVLKTFEKDTPGNLAKADANWPKLVEKHGK